MGLPHAHERQPPCPRSPCLTMRALCCEPSTCCARPDGRASCFFGVKLVDPTWTRERWEQAQAALAQWQQQQGRGRWQGEARSRGRQVRKVRETPRAGSHLRIMPWRAGCPYRTRHGQKAAVHARHCCLVWRITSPDAA